MNTNRGLVPRAFLVALLLAASLGHSAHAANSAAGIYKGSYASFGAGGDYGTVTIVINDQGATTCDFFSTPNGYGVITTDGSVTSTTPFLAMSCADGINNGGEWYAGSDSSSVAGGAIGGTWTSIVGVMTGPPLPTGTFQATYVSALTAIDPAAMAGAWEGGSGAFNFLPADAGFVVSFIGWTNEAHSTVTGVPVGPVAGSPLWLLSDVGPKTIFPGTPVTLNMYVPASSTAAQPIPSTVVPWGSMSITFLDCHDAIGTISGPTLSALGYMQMIAGVAGAPGC